jgi:outer membrane protein assembly factor BamA
MIPLVSGWVYSRFVPLALLQIFLWPRILCAQLPERLERCLPYPTLAQEIRAMKEETEPTEPQPPEIKRTVISVKFSPETHLPQSFRAQIVRSIKYVQFYDDSESDWLKELEEVGIKGLLQDSGYFRPKVEADARIVDGNLRNRRYSLTLRIEEGWQYRLGEIRFVNVRESEALAFPTSELREHIHLRRGEFFNVSKIRNGIEEIFKLYATHGYIDMVPEPDIQNDHDSGPIDVVMKLDEGKRYRVGKIEFLGLNEKTQNQLTPKLKPGEVFNRNLVDELLKRNKPLLPPDASWEDVSVHKNTKKGTVDIRFDFWTCPTFEY